MVRFSAYMLLLALLWPDAVAAQVRQGAALRAVPEAQRAPVVYQSRHGYLLFRASVAGRDVWAMVDSGTTSSAIDLGLAREAGVRMGAAGRPQKTPDGQLASRSAHDVAVRIPGQLEGRIARLNALDLSGMTRLLGQRVGLLLGQEFLRGMALRVDPEARTFWLAPTGSFGGGEGFHVLDLRNGRPQVEIGVGSERLLVTIDTGYNGQLDLTPATWRRIIAGGASRPAISADATGAFARTKAAVLPEVRMGAIRFADVRVRERDALAYWGDGSIGMGLLGRGPFTLDLGRGKLWVASAR